MRAIAEVETILRANNIARAGIGDLSNKANTISDSNTGGGALGAFRRDIAAVEEVAAGSVGE